MRASKDIIVHKRVPLLSNNNIVVNNNITLQIIKEDLDMDLWMQDPDMDPSNNIINTHFPLLQSTIT